MLFHTGNVGSNVTWYYKSYLIQVEVIFEPMLLNFDICNV